MYKKTLLLSLVLVGGQASASIVNASFENPNVNPGVFTSDGIPGWTNDSTSGVWDVFGAGFFNSVIDGNQVGYMNSGFLSQVSTYVIQEGTNTLSWYASNRKDGFTGNATYRMFAGGSASGGAISGGTLLGSQEILSTSLVTGDWTQFTISYDATAGDPLIGEFMGIQIEKTSGTQVNFDHFTFTPVPEPGTMLALGAGVLAAIRRRRS